MKILVVGGGGREHALVWKLVNDSCRPQVFCAPGNAGTAAVATNLAIGAEQIDALVDWARETRPDLTVIGPEAPLCLGLTDRLENEGLRVFGPRADAARIEGARPANLAKRPSRDLMPDGRAGQLVADTAVERRRRGEER